MKTILYILGFVALIAIIALLFLMWKNKQTAAQVLNGVAPLLSTGTQISLGGSGGTTTVLISELTQKLLQGMPFSDEPKLLDGTIKTKLLHNVLMGDIATGECFIWDKTSSFASVKGVGVGVGGFVASLQDKDPESLVNGVKYKNVVWQKTNEPTSASHITDGTYIMNTSITLCRAVGYFIIGTEKIYPMPIPYVDQFDNSSPSFKQWEIVDKAATQVNINTYASTHP